MGVKITGVGSYLPETVVTRAHWLEYEGGKPRYGQISADFFDIPEFVHHAGPEDGSAAMGAKACLTAIANANLKPEDIDLVICFSAIPDGVYPKDGQAIVHIAKLTNATAMDLDVACSSFNTLMKVGASFINQGLNKRVLLVCTANWVHRAIDKTQDYSPIGDGAGAVVIEQDASDSFIGICERRDERFYDFVRMPNPATSCKQEYIQFKFTDEFKSFLKSTATDVAKDLMVEKNIMPKQVDWLICHQVGVKALQGWCRILELAPEKLLNTYMWTGNCMAGNMPIVLDHYINKEPRIKRGDVVLFYALSSGFHSSAVLWRY